MTFLLSWEEDFGNHLPGQGAKRRLPKSSFHDNSCELFYSVFLQDLLDRLLDGFGPKGVAIV